MNAITKQAATAVHKGIAAALAAAQAQMGPALKDSANPAFKTKYADLSSVMAACMPALNSHGIAVIQPPYDDDTGRYVKTILMHGETGEVLECRVPLIVGKNDMQGYGSAVTYARRYGLMSMAGIAPDDDDGAAAAKSPPMIEQRPTVPSTTIAEAVAYLAGATSVDDLSARYKNLPKAVQSDGAVIASGAATKAKLQAAPADLAGDEIPY